MDKEKVIGIEALYNSMNNCAKGVKWKGTVAYYRHHWTDEIPRLSEQLHDGTYKERKAKFFYHNRAEAQRNNEHTFPRQGISAKS